jgi:subtilisin-like proprotein convertase family protein/putative transposon-encoded protein
MSRSISRRGLVSKPFASVVALLLTLTMAVPTWAVVFTNPASITLTDATAIGIGNPYPANIAVSGMTGTTTNVTVTLNNVNHTFPDDLDLLLVSPTADNLILLSDVGGSDDATNITITLDDAAGPTIPDATKLNAGPFKPTNIGTGDTWPAPAPAPSANTTFAAAFNGDDPNGTWNLYVVDDLGADAGTIGNGWSITVTTTGSSATTFTNGAAIHSGDGARGRASAYPSTIVASGLTGAITDVNVTLTNLSHLNPDDLDIVLVGPSGKRILLLSDAGGATDVVSANVTFDDAGAAVVPDGGPLVTATVRPTNFGTGETMPDMTFPYPNSATAGTATLASVFNGTNGNGTWSLYICDDATTSAGTLTGGWSIDITAGGNFGATRFTASDFDGDGRTDVAVQRPSTRDWYWRESTAYSNRAYTAFGLAGDVLVPADYDGDNKTDIAVWRPSTGVWYVVQSSTNTLSQVAWGNNGDTPVPADFDGDGLTDRAVYRGAGNWFILQSTTGQGRGVVWGAAGDIPVAGHFEGTNGADFTVFRAGTWYILENALASSRTVTLGSSGDVLTPGDYDGDGKTDAAVFRGSSGDFFIFNSSTSTLSGIHWGATGDVPVPGDYDGDSRTDVAVWRPANGAWYLLNSGTPAGAAALRTDSWGDPTDVAIPRTQIPATPVP